MKTFILNLSDSTSASFVHYTTYLKEVSIICEIPIDTYCLKVVGTIDFERVVFHKKFYSALKGNIGILDLSELKSSSSYKYLDLGFNDCSYYRHPKWTNLKEIVLPSELNNMPMIRNLPELKKIVAKGLKTFDNESKRDYHSGSNLSSCPNLEEIILGPNIKNITIRESSIKRINIPESNGSLQLEPYALAYNKKLEEVHLPQDLKELPIRLFEGCANLKKITGGNGLQEIGFGAFGGCKKLDSVPLRIELLKENQFLSYDEWMQYEPDNHIISWQDEISCAHCPKGVWSEKRNSWKPGCNYSIKNYCRDKELRKWKPYKKGIILKNGNIIWCFDDFTYYTTDILIDWCHKPQYAHKYVEFISPNVTFDAKGDHVNINYNPQEKKAVELSFPHNKLSEFIDSYFEEISYELIVDEVTQKVDELDIDAIIDSYITTFDHENFKMNSDTEGERYSLDRSAKYTDEYLSKLLPSIHEHYDDRNALVWHPRYTNPYKKKFDFGSCCSTFDKEKEDNWFSFDSSTGNIVRDAHNLKNKDEEVRKEAREKYNRRKHIDFLVNCRISEIINTKLEIESKLHIKQAENEFNNQRK